MNKALMISLLLTLGGCASHVCDEPWSESPCRAERLLYQNDLMQAKMLISAGDEDGYELAQALLERSAKQDKRGETEFYQALLLIRLGMPATAVLPLLEEAERKGHAHATALLFKVYDEAYLIDQPDSTKAAHYRQAYHHLDVAQSGYPSFDKALELVTQLIALPPRAGNVQSGTCPPYLTAPH